jgi:3'-phosphoadenosine 5'-phosphosulfate sulfotransferase (PAPS reductase)/FAD synthetase
MRRIASHLSALEAESIHLLREVAAEFERPVLLFSGGKDSVVMAHTAAKAFWPAKLPFPVMHVDTGHNFPEVIAFRDARAAELGERLLVRSVGESIRAGRVKLRRADESRNPHQTVTLLDAVKEFEFDALFGGARRDEEKARAKERILSHRDEFGAWDPRKKTFITVDTLREGKRSQRIQAVSAFMAPGYLRTLLTHIIFQLVYPIGFETPHYAASAIDYRAMAKVFRLFYERDMVHPDVNSIQYFPYTLTDSYGRFIVPKGAGVGSAFLPSTHATNDAQCSGSALAFSIRAAATLPLRWASRPASSSKVSKMAKAEGPSWMANQAMVPASALTRGTAARRKSATSFSLPGFACSGT